jgi:hypothetical protein
MHTEQLRALDYLHRKGSQAPLERLREQWREASRGVEALFDTVAEAERGTQPAPGKWSAHQILDHLVLSHGPAIAQFASLLDGVTPGGIAIPADLQSAPGQIAPWDDLRRELARIHREFNRLLDDASDGHSLEPKAVTAMVVKVDGEPVYWLESLDWKAFIQGIRVHTKEHGAQLQRALEAIR